MILENHNEIKKLKNCPLQNVEETITLYRFCENNPIENNDLIPFAISKPDMYKNDCLAWGLSLFDTEEATKKIIKGLSTKRRNKIKAIGKIVINNSVALKHQSGLNKNHYTVYPLKDVNLIIKFATNNI